MLDRQLDYWREQLAEPRRRWSCRPTGPGPPCSRYDGDERDASTCPPVVVAALRRLSAAEGATLFMTLLAGFAAVLHRYSGQDDVVVGCPVAEPDPAASSRA